MFNKRYFLMFLIFMTLGCGKKTSTPVDHPSVLTEQQSACGEVSIYPVSAHLMPATLYEIPDSCFEPQVAAETIAEENQRRTMLLNIIGVMEARPQNETGAQMLDFCWEKDWKWNNFPDQERPNHFPAVCAVPQFVTKDDVATVKTIENCRLDCLKK